MSTNPNSANPKPVPVKMDEETWRKIHSALRIESVIRGSALAPDLVKSKLKELNVSAVDYGFEKVGDFLNSLDGIVVIPPTETVATPLVVVTALREIDARYGIDITEIQAVALTLPRSDRRFKAMNNPGVQKRDEGAAATGQLAELESAIPEGAEVEQPAGVDLQDEENVSAAELEQDPADVQDEEAAFEAEISRAESEVDLQQGTAAGSSTEVLEGELVDSATGTLYEAPASDVVDAEYVVETGAAEPLAVAPGAESPSASTAEIKKPRRRTF